MNEDSTQQQYELVHIEYDAIEDAVLSGQGGTGGMQSASGALSDEDDEKQRMAWNQARAIALEHFEDELKRAQQTTSAEHAKRSTIILLDDNFHLRGMRKQIHRLALQHQPIQFGILYVKCDLDVCLHRNQQRQRGVPDHVIEKMQSTLEPPRAAWEVDSTLQVDTSTTTSIQQVLDFVLTCPKIVDIPEEQPDAEQQAADRAKTLANQTHAFDKLLRSWVGKVAKTDKKYGKAANAARKELLQRIKSGSLPEIDDEDQLKQVYLGMVFPENLEVNSELSAKIDTALDPTD
ncbi:MAG: hypothetical protein SGARI_000294 [Bacillariaceae sp.]